MENQIPQLTLDNQVPEAPVLTLENGEGQETAVAEVDTRPIAKLDDSLNEEEKAMVAEFSKKIDITNATQILQFGSTAQQKMTGFSETALANVRGKDMEEIGNMITGLVVELKGFSPDEKPKGLFANMKTHMAKVQAKYDTVAKNVDKICDVLEDHKMVLLKDVAMLDKMYEMNLAYYKELTMYILAGRRRLQEVESTELPALKRKAEESGMPEDAQAANYLADMCNRFDKKLHDLELTRTICIQMGPQIRLVQSNDSIMVEKIQSSLVNTIPLWKNQMVLSLGLAHSKSAIEAQRKVTDITNELLRKNADTLKMSTVEAAKESERGIVDIETLKYTNQSLISTLDEVMQIQQEGRQKRRDAEQELARIEGELKHKLLEIRDVTQSTRQR